MSIASATLADRIVPRTLVSDVALVFSGAVLTALAAQVQIPMYPVPMTLQTFAVLLVAATLGAAMGAAGLPVFAGAKALTAVLPTAGYLIGFVVAGFVVGLLAAKGFSTTPIRVAASFALGSTIIYALGAGWLVVGLGLTLPQALAAGVVPFLIGDALKALAAAALLPMAWKLVR